MTLSQLVDKHGFGIVVRKTTSKANEPVRIIKRQDDVVFLVEGTQTDEEYTERGDIEGFEKMQSAAEKLAGTVA